MYNNYENIKKCIDSMAKKDKKIRSKYSNVSGMEKIRLKSLMKKLDFANACYLKSIIRVFGWKEVIKNSSESVWILIQHSDHDINFQKRAYKAMKRHGDAYIKPWMIASLSDRINIKLGNPQKFGTQLSRNYISKKWEPINVFNVENINKNRYRVGLESMQAYLDSFNKINPIQ